MSLKSFYTLRTLLEESTEGVIVRCLIVYNFLQPELSGSFISELDFVTKKVFIFLRKSGWRFSESHYNRLIQEQLTYVTLIGANAFKQNAEQHDDDRFYRVSDLLLKHQKRIEAGN